MDPLRTSLLGDDAGPAEAATATLSPQSTVRVGDFRARSNSALPGWLYPPAGAAAELVAPATELREIRSHLDRPKPRLGEWRSTSICGNDILASVLYSSGLVAAKAGKLTPVAQLLVAVVLYFFRYIYEEAVTAIPLNGGSYNVLLNSTSKRVAAVAATLGIISYLATGVVSATSALQYLNTQVKLPIVESTVGLLFVFALLSIIGIGESASVALVIFVFHVITLSMLSGFSIWYALNHYEILEANWQTDFPTVQVAGDLVKGSVFSALFFGYSSAMLGITGFETSAQFVEEQQPGVFRKTLRNMWAFATFYNFLLSFLSLAVLPLSDMYQSPDVVLANMANASAGKWLESWVSIDAFIVLAGGVLTSYVGITGLVRRLAFDRVLPAFLTITNKWRGTNHYIILLFFAAQSSLVVWLNADATVLAGVFTFAFLGVMALFAFGCMLLKLKREEIPRDVHAPWWSCIFGLLMVLTGLLGNLLGNPSIFTYFALYFCAFAAVMFLMLERVFILRILLHIMQQLCPSRSARERWKRELPTSEVTLGVKQPDEGRRRDHTGAIGGKTITAVLRDIHLPPIVFFCKAPSLTVLNKAILYVRKNEQTHNLRIVHVSEDLETYGAVVTPADEQRRRHELTVVEDLREMVAMFDIMYPKLQIDFVSVRAPGGTLDPALVTWLAQAMSVQPNMMFIRQPSCIPIHRVAALGVRVITR